MAAILESVVKRRRKRKKQERDRKKEKSAFSSLFVVEDSSDSIKSVVRGAKVN